MGALEDTTFPAGNPDEVELFLDWLAFLRGAVLRKALGITDEQARWRPDGKMLPLVGIGHHLTNVQRRVMRGAMLGEPTSKDSDEYAPSLPIGLAIDLYRERAK